MIIEVNDTIRTENGSGTVLFVSGNSITVTGKIRNCNACDVVTVTKGKANRVVNRTSRHTG